MKANSAKAKAWLMITTLSGQMLLHTPIDCCWFETLHVNSGVKASESSQTVGKM